MSNLKRDGIITLEQAKKQFNEYYDSRNKTPAGRLRGKLFDAMYQKKKKIRVNPRRTRFREIFIRRGSEDV